jgi:zinc/manganese transport system substrate-binding protein
MRRRALLLAAPACLTVRAGAGTALPVVATFSILADMVREVGGPAVSVRSLVPPDGDPHVYEPRPSDLLAIRGAALVVTNGLGLEGWLDRLLPAAGTTAPVVVAAAGVAPRLLDQGVDPHAWQDPRNGMLYARAIAAGLVAVAPDRAAEIRARAEDYLRRIAETDAWIGQQMATVPPAQRRILTSHDAFYYFGARYGIEFIGVQGIDTESEPTAAGIAALLRQIRAEHISAVFVENMTGLQLARTVARESGAALGPTVYSDALSPPDGPADTYLKMLRYNAGLFVRAMRGG